jgi:hypothetical protein
MCAPGQAWDSPPGARRGTNLPPVRTALAQLQQHPLMADLADGLLGTTRADLVTERQLRARAMSGARDARSGRLPDGPTCL